MTQYIFAPPTRPALPVSGTDSHFPVHRIYCVARNYAAHAAELGMDARELPFFFMKPADALVPHGGVVPYPTRTNDMQHEVELVVALHQGGTQLTREQSTACVYGYAVGLDMTRRDLQHEARAHQRPWDMAKGFDASAPCSAIQRISDVGILSEGAITLHVNDTLKQRGDLRDMLWGVDDIIANLSQFVTLQPGDLIYTGTPRGVGPVTRGDVLTARIAGLGDLRVTIS